MKTIHLISFLVLFYTGYSQTVVDVDRERRPVTSQNFYSVGGFPVSTSKYVRLVSGSPYFNELWMKGSILINDSTEYHNISLRLDLLEGSLLYLSKNNEELISTMSVKAVVLVDSLTGTSYLFVNSKAIPGASPSGKDWYQLVAGKKAALYKQYLKRMVESKAYASSVTEQSITTEERYFIGINNTLTRVKKASDIADLAGDKRQALLDYIQKNKLNGKQESDLISVVEYYDSLK